MPAETLIQDLNGIQINIRKAKITGFNVSFDENNEITIYFDVSLLTATNKVITSVTLYNKNWNKEKELNLTDVEASVFEALGDVVALVSPIIIRKINGIGKLLAQESI